MSTVSERELDLLKKYATAVAKAPPSLHLTSDRDSQIFWERHVMDAVKLLEVIPAEYQKSSMKILDVGSGNGIPGIPFAILRPDWAVTMLDSDNKKCGFIDMFCNISAIKNVKIVAERAETQARGLMRASYDMVIARALGKLPVAIELTGAFVRSGGHLIVPHGTNWKEHTEKTMRAAEFMGLTLLQGIDYVVGDSKYSLLIYLKEKETRPDYPRSVGVPSKRPL
jgi:16S rRNA (guanine527-N7)-methyltransferase